MIYMMKSTSGIDDYCVTVIDETTKNSVVIDVCIPKKIYPEGKISIPATGAMSPKMVSQFKKAFDMAQMILDGELR